MQVADSVIVELRQTVDQHMARGGDAVAVRALESLAALIDDDRALRQVHAISVKATGKLKKKAAIALGDMCRRRNLTQDQLEDAIIRGLGVDDAGSITFDYGPRQVTVGFDTLMEPVALPRAAKDDDADKAARAAETWKTIKDEVKLLASARAHRLERAMCDDRFWWTSESFAKHFVGKSLLQQIARRLIYAAVDPQGHVLATFRVAEDGTYAGPDDKAVTIEPHARVVVAHPALIEPAVRDAWARVLDDYEILQPFPQIARDAPALPPEVLKTRTTDLFKGQTATGGRLFAMYRAGWQASWNGLGKDLGSCTARLALDPGIESFATKPADQTIGVLELEGASFGELSRVARWELLREVHLATGAK